MHSEQKKAESALKKALKIYEKTLEKGVLDALKKLSKKHPRKRVIFRASMGNWEWLVGVGNDLSRYERKPPRMDEVLHKALDDWGWEVIPLHREHVFVNGRRVKGDRGCTK